MAIAALVIAMTLSAAACTQPGTPVAQQGSHGVDYTPDFSYGGHQGFGR